MEFRILGPLEVVSESGVLDLGGGRHRALLALLLLRANEVVTGDSLLDELWGNAAPASARKIVQLYVSRLRKSLGNGVLVTRGAGYALLVDPDRLDAHRFEQLLEEGRTALAAGKPALASATLREGLSLWRGPALADFAYEGFAQTPAARLEELRTAALEARMEADLALGHEAELVGELEALVAAHPLRERLRAQLMLALYRCGRQADALTVYQETRAVLVEELGIEPGPELRELQRAILRQDAALAAGPVPEPSPVVVRGTFVGRERELAELEAALGQALEGSGRLILLAGEPGIGKSRLGEELIAHARARGARALVGRCWEAGGAPAYWPWVQSLRAYVRDTDPDTLRAQLGAGAAHLAQLLPEVREQLPDLPEAPALETEGARFRLFEAVSGLLASAARAQPLVLALDDLHAADEPSLLLLQFVAREIAGHRLLLLCTYRDVDPTLRDPLVATLAQLVREPHTHHIELPGLTKSDIAGYIQLSTGTEATPRTVDAIHDETEGNPLFVSELVRLLDAEGRMADADAHLDIPPGVRAVISRRVGRLAEQCRSLLGLAAVLGREFDLQVLTQLRRLPPDELLRVLDEAMAERVVTVTPGSPGRLRFGHALIRDTLYDDLTPARRVRLHRDAAEALKALYASNLGPHLAELAHHYYAAVPAGEAPRAIDYARRAGDRASSQLAYEEAVRLYDMALSLAEEPRIRCDLLLARGDALAKAGDTPASKQSFREAAELAGDLELPGELARAALGYGSRFVWEVSRDDDYLVPLLERALEALGDGDDPLRVRVLARLAGGPLRDVSFGTDRRRSLGEEALEMARRIGDPGTLAYALAGYIAANHSPAFTRQQVAFATEASQAALEAGDLERELEGYDNRYPALIELGDMEAAKADLAAMARLAKELRQPSHDWVVGVYRALLALLEGRLSEAEELIAQTRSLGERAQAWSAAVSYGLQLYVLRREQGRLAEIEALVRDAVSQYPTYPIWRCVLAQTAAELGYDTESRAALDALAANDFQDLACDEEWLVSMGLLADTAARLEDVRHAQRLYDLLLPYSDRVAVAYPEISTGAVARHLGLLASMNGEWEAAERHFEDAIALNEKIGARSWLARTQHDYARMLLERENAGDLERARALTQVGTAAAADLGIALRAT